MDETRANEEPQDAFTAALMPVVLHRLNNASQRLSMLNALLVADAAGRWLEERSEDLAETSASVDELGWLLAVLASASGADLLLERREARGLAILIDSVGGALRREGRELAPAEGPLPALAPHVGAGWELPWAVGATLYAAGADGEAPLTWRLAREAGAWRLVADAAPTAARLADLRGLLARRCPGVELDVAGGTTTLALPESWLAPADAGGPA